MEEKKIELNAVREVDTLYFIMGNVNGQDFEIEDYFFKIQDAVEALDLTEIEDFDISQEEIQSYSFRIAKKVHRNGVWINEELLDDDMI